MARVRWFRDLRVYRAAYEAAMAVFRVSLGFPDDERYGLTSQIRRSSRSVAANIAEAWRKRRYPAAFIAKLNDAEAEAAETRAHLDFALGCRYLARDDYHRLDRDYAILTRQLVRMITQAPRWAPGRASGRTGRPASAHPPSPSPGARKTKEEESPVPKTAANVPPLSRNEGATPEQPSNPDRP